MGLDQTSRRTMKSESQRPKPIRIPKAEVEWGAPAAAPGCAKLSCLLCGHSLQDPLAHQGGGRNAFVGSELPKLLNLGDRDPQAVHLGWIPRRMLAPIARPVVLFIRVPLGFL